MKHYIFLTENKSNRGIYLYLRKNIIVHEPHELNIGEISSIPNDEKLCLVLSDQLVSKFNLQLKAKNQSQLLKAASFAIEEKLPERIDNYHVVIHKSSSDKVWVRAIKRIKLEQILKQLQEHNLTPDSVIVESDLFAKTTPALLFNSTEATLCGADLPQSYQFDASLVPMISQKIYGLLDAKNEIQLIYTETNQLQVEAFENQSPENIRIKKIIKNDEYYKTICRQDESAVNLLQGDFASQAVTGPDESIWKYPAWLALAGILISSGSLIAQNLIQNNRISKQEIKIKEQYAYLFPDASKPSSLIDLQNKIKIKKKQFNSQSNKTSMPIDPLTLFDLFANISKTSSMQILGINIDQNLAEILISANDVDSLNKVKSIIEKQLPDGISMSMDSINAKNDVYHGKIVIR
ncbi:MAG: hypothetical protein HKN88_04820 [Gammaproteobacteria bacterium]|nr:hypothetical protein [Gammaproteobacteria bacterium]NNC97376.1 hypothetical protein [Gammaproteobacteria bacterium]NNM13105.1 hypothetical protein [Gammaproteobacteria bacterium]